MFLWFFKKRKNVNTASAIILRNVRMTVRRCRRRNQVKTYDRNSPHTVNFGFGSLLEDFLFTH